MLHHVKDLSPEQRHAAELLLGHSVSEHETLSIKSVGPSTLIPSALTFEQRMEALRSLNERLGTAAGPECSAAEQEAIVNEALRSVRPRYRPIG